MCTTSTSSKIVEQACRQPSCSGNCSSSPPRMLGAAKKPCFKAAPRSRLPPCKQVALVKQLVRSTVATCPGLAAGTVAKLRRVVSQGGQPEQFVYAQLLEVPGAKQALVGLLDLETSTVEVVLDALALLHNGPCIGGSEDLKAEWALAELQSRTSVPSSDSTQAVHAQLLAPTALAALVTEVPRLEIPRMKIPRLEVPRPEVPRPRTTAPILLSETVITEMLDVMIEEDEEWFKELL